MAGRIELLGIYQLPVTEELARSQAEVSFGRVAARSGSGVGGWQVLNSWVACPLPFFCKGWDCFSLAPFSVRTAWELTLLTSTLPLPRLVLL